MQHQAAFHNMKNLSKQDYEDVEKFCKHTVFDDQTYRTEYDFGCSSIVFEGKQHYATDDTIKIKSVTLHGEDWLDTLLHHLEQPGNTYVNSEEMEWCTMLMYSIAKLCWRDF